MSSTTAAKAGLDRLLAGAQLPALPQSAIKLLELSQDPNNGPAEFACPIEADPGLASQVLRFVNSSYFGFSQEITSVKLAITLVGVRTIKNFALWSAVFSLLPNPRCGPFDLKSMRQDALRRALFARALARQLGVKEPEEVFTAALLQDIAIPILAKEMSDVYAKLLMQREAGRRRLSELECEQFGWTHADVGALLIEKWNLPGGFARLIEQHTELEECLANCQENLPAAIVALSALLPAIGDPQWTDWPVFDRTYQQMVPTGEPAAAQLLKVTDEQFEDLAPVLKLAVPSKTLTQELEEVVRSGT